MTSGCGWTAVDGGIAHFELTGRVFSGAQPRKRSAPSALPKATAAARAAMTIANGRREREAAGISSDSGGRTVLLRFIVRGGGSLQGFGEKCAFRLGEGVELPTIETSSAVDDRPRERRPEERSAAEVSV